MEKIKGTTSIFNKERKIVPIGFIHTIPGLYIILPLKQNRLKFSTPPKKEDFLNFCRIYKRNTTLALVSGISERLKDF